MSGDVIQVLAIVVTTSASGAASFTASLPAFGYITMSAPVCDSEQEPTSNTTGTDVEHENTKPRRPEKEGLQCMSIRRAPRSGAHGLRGRPARRISLLLISLSPVD
jgi:hypothetical protein